MCPALIPTRLETLNYLAADTVVCSRNVCPLIHPLWSFLRFLSCVASYVARIRNKTVLVVAAVFDGLTAFLCKTPKLAALPDSHEKKHAAPCVAFAVSFALSRSMAMSSCLVCVGRHAHCLASIESMKNTAIQDRVLAT